MHLEIMIQPRKINRDYKICKNEINIVATMLCNAVEFNEYFLVVIGTYCIFNT